MNWRASCNRWTSTGPKKRLDAPPTASTPASWIGLFVSLVHDRLNRLHLWLRPDCIRSAFNGGKAAILVEPVDGVVSSESGTREFASNDRVWYYSPRKRSGKYLKFCFLYQGPFIIVEMVGPVNYRIKLEKEGNSFVTLVDKLKKCLGSYDQPPQEPRGEDEGRDQQ